MRKLVPVVAVVQTSTMFGLLAIDRELQKAAARYGIEMRTSTTVRAIRAEERVLETTSPDGPADIGYDLLHFTPGVRAPGWISASSLSDGDSSFVAYKISAHRPGRPMKRYSGYFFAPISTSRSSLLLAEFDRAGNLQSIFGLGDLARPRPWTFVFDRYLQPTVCWRGILTGRA